jgi:hypothetical protein
MGVNEINGENSKHLQRIAEDFVKEKLIHQYHQDSRPRQVCRVRRLNWKGKEPR